MIKKITVITTVRNGEKYILETLESVKNQIFNHFEHIIIDDGSSDSTIKIIQDFKGKYPNYDLQLFQPGKLGRGKALNYAVSKANGEYIAIIDADDLWHPLKLEIQVNVMDSEGIDLLATKSNIFTCVNEIAFGKLTKGQVRYFSIKDLLKSNKLSHSSVLIKKELCLYDDSRNSQFDYELWLRLAWKNKKIAEVTNVLNYHRIHMNQSFENNMGKVYRWSDFKLKFYFIIKTHSYYLLILALFKLIVTLVLPRNIILSRHK